MMHTISRKILSWSKVQLNCVLSILELDFKWVEYVSPCGFGFSWVNKILFSAKINFWWVRRSQYCFHQYHLCSSDRPKSTTFGRKWWTRVSEHLKNQRTEDYLLVDLPQYENFFKNFDGHLAFRIWTNNILVHTMDS